MAVKVRSAEEIKALDDELGLMDDSDWVFVDVLNTQMKNAEYFNDVRDDDFLKQKSGVAVVSGLFPVLAMAAVLVMSFLLFLSYRMRDDSDFRVLAGTKSVMEASEADRVDGEEAGSDMVLQADAALSAYFGGLKSEDYSALYSQCLRTSAFADAYYAATNKVAALYDDSDCYARMLRTLSGFCSTGRILSLIERDGSYYCYVEFTYPNALDVQEYLNLYSYNMTKYFSQHDVTEQEFIRFMVDITSSSAMRCHTEEYCIVMAESGGSLKLVGDAFMLELCDKAYQSFVTQMSNMLSGNTAFD